jgi:hypothetical protein
VLGLGFENLAQFHCVAISLSDVSDNAKLYATRDSDSDWAAALRGFFLFVQRTPPVATLNFGSTKLCRCSICQDKFADLLMFAKFIMLLFAINRDFADHFRAQNTDSPSPVHACPCP